MPTRYRSKLAIYDLAARSSRVVFSADQLIEAPNWSRDGRYLLVNTEGALCRLALPEARALEVVRLDGAYSCNNDHDLSPDGQRIAFSAASPACAASRVYVANADGSEVRLITDAAPSYFHGWSPDGAWLAFVAERGDGKFEIYRVPAAGGKEERLTSAGGYDDGCEYSPDGAFIYFNSNRSGDWSIWRMPASGAGEGDAFAERVTFDAQEDWFPHLSPDGRSLLVLSFPAGTQGHDDRLPGMQLRLRQTPGQRVERSELELLAEFFGGQGSINVNSWSPDSRQFAFMIYEPLPE